jgi:sn-glycerol 3-phosphate transport system ATP-binding protein
VASITCSGISKIYQREPAVAGIDLQVADGEFIVIVGPSGCGKSTFLRMIAGLETITDGTLHIGDRVVNDLEPKERDIAMVFQNYALYPHMSVYGNMAYGLKNRGIAKNEIKRQIERAAKMLQLDQEMLTRKPRALSGGQRQRVAMGRAIVREPQVFLFDEPLSNLDAKLRVQMRVEIKQLHQLLDVTTVYVTHDQVEAMTLAQRLVVMNDGRVEQVGTPKEVYANPASLFVATFIGSPAMNLLPGELNGEIVEAAGIRWALQSAPVASGVRRVMLGIRPEHLTQATNETREFELTVTLVEDLGADMLVHGQLDQHDLVARLPGTSDIHAGDRIGLRRTSESAIQLFDREEGHRLQLKTAPKWNST